MTRSLLLGANPLCNGGGSVKTVTDIRLFALLSSWGRQAQRPQRLIVKSGDRIVFLLLDEIDWIEAAGNYVRVHVGAETYLVRESLKSLETKLDARFLRADRSMLVNADHIRMIVFGGRDPVIELRDGTHVPASRQIETHIQGWLETTSK